MMRKSGTRLWWILLTACINSLFIVPDFSFGAPQASFTPVGKKNLEKLTQISLKDIRQLEKSPFDIPEFLRPAVNFWTNIYTQFSGNQVVLHDKKYLSIVYEVVDFSDIYNRNISYRRKRRLRRKRIERNREKIQQTLKSLARKKIKPDKLTGLEKKIYDLYRTVEEKNKFKAAVKRVRAQIGHRESFRKGLINSGLYIGQMEQIFLSYDLPIELTRLPFVESFFNPKAFSKRGASGVWQFIRSTGRLFLTINRTVDERNDPFKATHAAAKLLKGNYENLGSWPLAVTAYNHGRLGVSRAVKEIGSNNLGDIIEKYRRRRFGFASRNFYAEFLAALHIYRDYTKYFKDIPIKSPFQFEIFKLPDFVSARSLAKYCHLSPEVIHEYNPELSLSIIVSQRYIPQGYQMRIPQEISQAFAKNYSAMPGRLKMTAQKAFERHRVRRGQTLSQIARRYRVRVTDIMALNNLPSRHYIRAGQVLKLPKLASSKKSKKKISVASAKKVIKTARNVSAKKEKHKTAQAKIKGYVKSTKKKVAEKRVVKKKVTKKYTPIFSSLDEKDISVSSGTLVIKKSMGNPKILSSFSQRSSSPSESEFESEPVIAVIDHPTKDGVIIVQPHETLGHYADWAEIATSHLRWLNSLSFEKQIKVGQKIKLSFSKIDKEKFHSRRRQYHLDLQNLYLSQYKVDKIKKHILKKEQNIWTLCQRVYKIPLWLLKKYNTGKDLTKLSAGDALHIPIVVKITEIN
jgi:membrane-bound lytic murein transglycosylase D